MAKIRQKIPSTVTLKNSIKRQAEDIVNLILPPRCAFSGRIVSSPGQIIPEVWANLQFIANPQCSCCGVPFSFQMEENALCAGCLKDRPEFEKARAPLVYDDQSRELVLRFKHADQIQTLGTFLPWMLRSGDTLLAQADIILPVPLHRWRLLKRRYNQAALIAKALSKSTHIPWSPDVLERTKSTAPQGYMKPDERSRNVRNAFVIKEKNQAEVSGKNILLIDDVYTTGATVRECTRVLLKAGAETVNVLCLARVVKGTN